MKLAWVVVSCGVLISCGEGSRECFCTAWNAELVQVPISSEEAAVSARLFGPDCGEPQALKCSPARAHAEGCSGFIGWLYGDGTGRERTCNVKVDFSDGTSWESSFRWSREKTDCCPLLSVQSDALLIVPENHPLPYFEAPDLASADLGGLADMAR